MQTIRVISLFNKTLDVYKPVIAGITEPDALLGLQSLLPKLSDETWDKDLRMTNTVEVVGRIEDDEDTKKQLYSPGDPIDNTDTDKKSKSLSAGERNAVLKKKHKLDKEETPVQKLKYVTRKTAGTCDHPEEARTKEKSDRLGTLEICRQCGVIVSDFM